MPLDSLVLAESSVWRASLHLGFERRGRGTVLSDRLHSGPLQVQRPFYPEANGVCHVYILHPPGGVVGGDQLDIDVELQADADALITTPAAGKFYRSAGATAQQRQILRVGHGAALEWMPQESIIYNGARLDTMTRVELAATARFFGWEILCLGRPAAAETFQRGALHQRFEIWREGKPLYLERGDYRGGSALLQARWGLYGQPVTATLLCVGADHPLDEIARAAIAIADGEQIGISQCDEVLVCRYAGPSAEQAKTLFQIVWRALRPELLQRPACAPRIWNT